MEFTQEQLKNMQTKISSSGWFCILVDKKFVPVFKLTQEQINDFRNFVYATSD